MAAADGLQAIAWWAEGERDLLKEYCEQDVRALARMVCLPELRLPRIRATAPNYVFGIASALAARRASQNRPAPRRARGGSASGPGRSGRRR